MSALRPEGGWCWVENDPEMTFSDPLGWLDEVGCYSPVPHVQRFDWGVPAPSTWMVSFCDDETGIRTTEEFATEAEALAFAAKARGGAQ